MLPILRTTLLGSALAAAAFLTGFTVPDGTRVHFVRPPAPAHGPLLETQTHPEWKQFMVLAALRRANELDSLKKLPDGPVAASPPPAINNTVATLPATPAESEPEDATGSVATTPDAALQVDIGESSSTELPVGQPQIIPPAQRPESLKPARDSQRKILRKHRRARVKTKPVQAAAATSNPFAALFGPATPPAPAPTH